MIKDLFLVGCGSFLGGTARYLLAVLLKGASAYFPWATLAANLAGCLLLGIFWALLDRCQAPPATGLFLITGFCGGFTTFSTFSRESLILLQAGSHGAFLLYALGSLALGLLAVAAGFFLAR